MRMTGADMVVKTLEKNGVKVVFGYPGNIQALYLAAPRQKGGGFRA